MHVLINGKIELNLKFQGRVMASSTSAQASALSENINKRMKIGFTVFSKTALINIIASAINFSKNASPQLYFPPPPLF